VGRKPARCKLCQHTTEMHVIDKDGTYCLICRGYEFQR